MRAFTRSILPSTRLSTVRPFSTSPFYLAAAAPSPSSSSSPRRFVRKAAPPSTSTPSTSSTPASASSSTSSRSAPVSLPQFEEDFPLPPLPESSNPGPALTPTPSPPLTALPGAEYVPLPSVPGSVGESAPLGAAGVGGAVGARFAGEAPGLGTATATGADDWSTSFKGLSERPFDKEVAEALLRPLEADDVEIKPDGLLYLPEIKYRRTLNAAFGPGGWGMAPRGESNIGPRIVSREWGLVCLGRLVAIARGEQEYFDPSGVPTAIEACKSNALMRCCKDLGIASELWDPRFIREFKSKHCTEVMVEHVVQKKKRKLWRKKEAKFDYPYKELAK